MSADGKAIGTIEIKDAIIQTPAGGKVIDYRNKEELSDGIVYEAGQTIGTAMPRLTPPMTPLSPRARSSCLPRRPSPRKSTARPSPRVPSPRARKTTKTVAVAAKGAKTVGKLAATGDTSNAAIVAAALAGTAAIAAGALASRKRS